MFLWIKKEKNSKEILKLNNFDFRYQEYLKLLDSNILEALVIEYKSLKEFFLTIEHAGLLSVYCKKYGINCNMIENFYLKYDKIVDLFNDLKKHYQKQYFDDDNLNEIALNLCEFALKKSKEKNEVFWKILSNEDIKNICLKYFELGEQFELNKGRMNQDKVKKYGLEINAIISYYIERDNQNNIYFNKIIEAYKFLNHHNLHFGTYKLCGYLKGSNSCNFLSDKEIENQYFGSMNELNKDHISSMISYLLKIGVFSITKGLYPLLKINKSLSNVPVELIKEYEYEKEKHVEIKKDEEDLIEDEYLYDDSGVLLTDIDLYEILKKERSKLASEFKVKSYIIATNKLLVRLATFKPLTKEDFLKIKFVGEKNFELYLKYFLCTITDYINKDNN